MNARNRWLMMICIAATGVMGCDKSPSKMTITVVPASAPAASPDGPTTQELMAGSYKTVVLDPLPFSAKVPQSWDIKSLAGAKLNLLQGPIPDGSEVQISLTTGTPMPSSKLDGMLVAAQRVADSEKQTTRLFNVKSIGDMKVMEVQKLVSGGDASQAQAIDWQISYFVRGEVDYSVYVLDVSLTEAQYAQSKDLLRKIFDSIVYQPSPAG